MSLALLVLFAGSQVLAQGGPLAGFMVTPIVPEQATVANIPSIRPITGRGDAWDSSPAQWPGYGIDDFNYEIDEYYISGTAAG